MTPTRLQATTLAAIAAALVGSAPARAEIVDFHAKLDGISGAAPTGSPATGEARIRVNTQTRRVSAELKVKGITLADLWDPLVAGPIGPVHLHTYAAVEDGTSALALPLAFGPAYRPTDEGFQVVTQESDYAAGAVLVNSDLDFNAFLSAMRAGRVVINVHTDAFNPGEISGRVAQRP